MERGETLSRGTFFSFLLLNKDCLGTLPNYLNINVIMTLRGGVRAMTLILASTT